MLTPSNATRGERGGLAARGPQNKVAGEEARAEGADEGDPGLNMRSPRCHCRPQDAHVNLEELGHQELVERERSDRCDRQFLRIASIRDEKRSLPLPRCCVSVSLQIERKEPKGQTSVALATDNSRCGPGKQEEVEGRDRSAQEEKREHSHAQRTKANAFFFMFVQGDGKRGIDR